jgi:hypothetical protein
LPNEWISQKDGRAYHLHKNWFQNSADSPSLLASKDKIGSGKKIWFFKLLVLFWFSIQFLELSDDNILQKILNLIRKNVSNIFLHLWCSLITICGLYYKHVTILNDVSIVISKWSFKLIDDPRVIIYDCHWFIIQATECIGSLAVLILLLITFVCINL